mmetsp:Transcript_33982/g.33126  ORF Transcript_33982/g.33126 Transcript_33982/m.33126 type:complete len:307 (+) Transcript_33982:58-978(+)
MGKEMFSVEEFGFLIDKNKPDFLDLLWQKGHVRDGIEEVAHLNAKEREKYDQLVQDYFDQHKHRWKDILQSSLKYRKVFMVNANYLPDLAAEEKVYVYPLFVEAGKHKFIVQGAQDITVHNFISTVREEDIPIYVKQHKMKVVERVFKKETSVFKDWKEDTPAVLEKCIQHDLNLWKIPRFVKDPQEQEKLWGIAEKHFKKLKDIFLTLACRSIYPCISWIDFTNYCEICKIPDKSVVLATIDRLFIATNVELEAMDDNPDKALCRYEYLEILVRIANAKFRETGVVGTHSEAFQKLLDENILSTV